MGDALGAQVKRLSHGSSVFRRQAAFGIFQLLASRAARASSDAAADAVSTCLGDRHAEVVDESVTQLLRLVEGSALPGIDAAAALQLLLAALEGATARTAPLLARGVVSAYLLRQRAAGSGAAALASRDGGGTAASQSEAWGRHPLSAALAAHAAGAQQLLDGTCATLAHAAASNGDPAALQQTWQWLQPFFSFVLLRASADWPGAAALPALRASLVGALVRVACCNGEAAQLVVPFLLRHLACMPLGGDEAGGTQARVQAASFLGDTADALDAHSPAAATQQQQQQQQQPPRPAAPTPSVPAEWWWAQVRDAVTLSISLAAQLSAAGVGPGPVLPVMGRLAEMATEAAEGGGSSGASGDAAVWADWVPELAVLAMQTSDQEHCALIALAAGAIEARAQGTKQEHVAATAPRGFSTPEAALLAVPLLHSLVLSPSADAKRWAAALLAAAQGQARPWRHHSKGKVSPGNLAQLCCQGELVTVEAARRLLYRVWPDDGAAVEWLRALTAAVVAAREAAAANDRGGGAAPAAFSVPLQSARALREEQELGCTGPGGGAGGTLNELGPGACALLGALLVHPSPRAVDAAARCLRELALVLPASAPLFLPPLLLQLRRLSSGPPPKGCNALDVASAQASLLAVLPSLTSDPTLAAMAVRALQPLAAPTAPPALRGAALRLAVQGWRATGRGWARAEAAINGYAPPGTTALAAAAPGSLGPRARDMPPVELRLSRAAALRDVCSSGSGRALELVWSLQDALADTCPAVVALALDAIHALASDDALDFYAAWPVITTALPRPPDAPQAAARWVALLACGAWDAEAHPEAAAAVLDLLWAATGHTHPLVRAAAYRGLAAYPIPLLEKMELDAPAGDYTAPLGLEAAALTEVLAAAAAGTRGAAAAVAAAREAVAAAEALAGVAIAHEHEQRRRFLVSAVRSSGAAGGGGGGSGAAAAAGREEASLRHRLLHTARAVALAGDAGGSGAPAARSAVAPQLGAGGASPGALLLLWQPPAASGATQQRGTSSSSIAAASGGYGRLLDDAAARLLWSPWTHPALAAAAWHAFTVRWLAASGQGAEGMLQSLRSRWREGSAGDAAAACWAAAGLAACGALSESQMSEVVGELRRLMRAGPSGGVGVSAAVVQAAAAAAARVLPALHPADWQTREGVAGSLRALLTAPTGGRGDGEGEEGGGGGSGGGVRSAAAEALAFAACHTLRLGGGGGGALEGEDRGLALGCSALGTLLSALATLQPSSAAAVSDMAAQLPPEWQRLAGAQLSVALDLAPAAACEEDPWLLAALRRGVVAISAALHERRPMPVLLKVLQSEAERAAAADASDARINTSSSGSTQRAAALGALEALASIVVLGLDALPDGPAAAQRAARALQRTAIAPLVDGWVGGAAALGWARVCGALLQRGIALPTGGGHADSQGDVTLTTEEAAVEAASCLVETLSALCSGRAPPPGADTAGEGPSGGHRGTAAGALRCGAASGLAALLGADPGAGAYGDGLGADGLPATPAAAWLLQPASGQSAVGRVRAARSALRALEAAALGGRTPSGTATGGGGGGAAAASAAAAPLAGWLLAAASVAASARGATAGAKGAAAAGGAAAAPPLAAYPEEGALRPLAERLLLPGSGEERPPFAATAADASAPGAVEAASLLRVLSAAPRLPAAGWEPLARRLLLRPPSAASGPSAAGELRLAALELVLAHASVAALGLSPVLDHALMPAAFAQLPTPCRAELLRRLPNAVRCLPANRSAPLLQGLPALVPTAGPEAGELTEAAWSGLRGLCEALTARDPGVSGKGVAPPLVAAIAALGSRLPVLPSLLPGQTLALLEPGLGAGLASNGGASDSDSAWVAPQQLAAADWQVWLAAVGCLRRLKQEQAAALTQPSPAADGSSPSRQSTGPLIGAPGDAGATLRAQLRCLLVLSGLLSWRELTPCRALLVNSPQPLLGGDGAASGAAASVVPLLAAASCAAPQTAQAQLLQEALTAARLCPQPSNALVLAAAMVGAWQQQQQRERHNHTQGAAGSSSSGAIAAVDAAVFDGSGDPGAALQALPHTLPALAASRAWAPSVAAAAEGLLAAARLPCVPPSAAGAVDAAVLAVRQQLGAAAWEALATGVATA